VGTGRIDLAPLADKADMSAIGAISGKFTEKTGLSEGSVAGKRIRHNRDGQHRNPGQPVR
jgi:hypothetical protein